ncbi:MAG: hypothetical protein HZA77_06675 [Candidatus Schekmanbacteria bacterium]|nr:hypothetical protein [Candidatus Schekmanbacteria bacterium]
MFRCADCNEIFAFTPFDSCPQYETALQSGQYIEICQNDRTSIINMHSNHNVVELYIQHETLASEVPLSEPVKTVFFNARDNQNSFAIKRSHGNITALSKYEVAGEFVMMSVVSISVQEEEIARQLTFDFPDLQLEKRDQIISQFKKIAGKLKYNEITDTYEDDRNPLVEYAVIKKKKITNFINLIFWLFEEDEGKRFMEKLNDYFAPYGCMNLVVRKKIVIGNASQLSNILKFPAREELVNLRDVV